MVAKSVPHHAQPDHDATGKCERAIHETPVCANTERVGEPQQENPAQDAVRSWAGTTGSTSWRRPIVRLPVASGGPPAPRSGRPPPRPARSTGRPAASPTTAVIKDPPDRCVARATPPGARGRHEHRLGHTASPSADTQAQAGENVTIVALRDGIAPPLIGDIVKRTARRDHGPAAGPCQKVRRGRLGTRGGVRQRHDHRPRDGAAIARTAASVNAPAGPRHRSRSWGGRS